jgi:hypothetical protein
MTAPATDLAVEVTVQLAALGSTPTQIAETLLEQGVSGIRGSGLSCPISNYLTGKCGITKVAAGWRTITVAAGPDDSLTPVPTPPPVAGFITAFDKGAFDELVNGVIDGWEMSTERGGR